MTMKDSGAVVTPVSYASCVTVGVPSVNCTIRVFPSLLSPLALEPGTPPSPSHFAHAGWRLTNVMRVTAKVRANEEPADERSSFRYPNIGARCLDIVPACGARVCGRRGSSVFNTR